MTNIKIVSKNEKTIQELEREWNQALYNLVTTDMTQEFIRKAEINFTIITFDEDTRRKLINNYPKIKSLLEDNPTTLQKVYAWILRKLQ